MKRKIACALACMLFALPMSACGESKKEITVKDSTVIEEEIEGGNVVRDPETIAPNEPNGGGHVGEEGENSPSAPPEAIPLPPVTGEAPEEEPPEEEPEPVDPPVVEIPPVTKSATYVMTLTDGLNVRTGAGTQYRSLGTVERGVLLKYGGKQGDWYETEYCGQTAYVSAKTAYTKLYEMALDGLNDTVEKVIENGLKYLGTPYVFGAVRYHDGRGNKLTGFTTSAFDCSSLMQYIFYQGAGVLLNLTTRTQIGQGTSVDKLTRGDLMFFTNESRKNNTGIERVGHVALYLGDNYILHTASDYAKIEQISATRWSYFISARRMI